jgi:hypothetical protein
MFYLIVNTYVGPNRNDSNFNWNLNPEDGELTIQTVPGYTNMSNETCIVGWLGCTNNNDAYAKGAFETLEEAQKAATHLGYTEIVETPYEHLVEGEIVETRRSKRGTTDCWQASDWLRNGMSAREIAESLSLTKDSTDDEIVNASWDIENEAASQNITLIDAEQALRSVIEDLEQ